MHTCNRVGVKVPVAVEIAEADTVREAWTAHPATASRLSRARAAQTELGVVLQGQRLEPRAERQ